MEQVYLLTDLHSLLTGTVNSGVLSIYSDSAELQAIDASKITLEIHFRGLEGIFISICFLNPTGIAWNRFLIIFDALYSSNQYGGSPSSPFLLGKVGSTK